MKTRILFSHRARRLFFFVHLWGGLILGAWFSLLGITGSALAWREELGAAEIRWRYPVVKPSAEATMLSLAQVTDSLTAALPDLDLTEVSAVTVPNSRASAYAFTIGRNRRQMRSVLLDPYTGKILGTVQPRSGLMATVNQLHASLLGGVRSYVFNGFLTVLALPLLISGLWLWWPSNIRQLKARLTVKRGASLKRTLYDLHNVMGIYLYVVLFATTLTGALLVGNHIARDGIPQTLAELKSGGEPPGAVRGRRGEGAREGGKSREGGREGGMGREGSPATGREPRGRAAETTGSPPGEAEPTVAVGPKRMENDELLKLAREAIGNYEITRVQPPQHPEQTFRASYSVSGGFARNRTVFIDPYTGKVLPSEAPGADYNAVVRGLHFGNFAGVPMKWIYTVTGFMPLGLYITGLWLWLRKKLRQKKRPAGKSEPEKVLEEEMQAVTV